MKNFQFSTIPKIHFGPGTISSLPSIVTQNGLPVLIIVSRAFSGTAIFTQLKDSLHEQSIQTTVVDHSGEPTPGFVDKVVEQAKSLAPGYIISIGGGSIVDAGKAISAMIPVGGGVKDYLEGVGPKKHPGTKIPFIAVPTTAGTGSEATKNAVLSEPGPKGFKKSLRHDRFVPDVTIIYPELTLSCPTEVSMPVGLDAFTQLLEAYTSTNASGLTDLLAIDGLKSAIRSLPLVFEDPVNLEARSGMSYAALISGIALANAGLGVVHGFASAIGGMIPVPHGVICGTLLAPATRINIRKLISTRTNPPGLRKYAGTGKLFSKESGDDEFYLDLLINTLTKWTSRFRIPKLSTYGLSASDFDQIIDNTSLKNNPVKLNRDELIQILNETT